MLITINYLYKRLIVEGVETPEVSDGLADVAEDGIGQTAAEADQQQEGQVQGAHGTLLHFVSSIVNVDYVTF